MEPLGCPVVATCGGCPQMASSASQRMSMHSERLRDALRVKVGESAARRSIRSVTLPQHAGYRRRIRLRVVDGERLGFFNTAKSPTCAVLTAALRPILERLVRTAPRFREALSPLQHVELREPDDDGIAAAFFVKQDPKVSLSIAASHGLEDWLEDMKWAVAGETRPVPVQRLTLPGVWHHVPIGSFLQVNRAVNAALVTDVLTRVGQVQATTFCDLYAGSGNFTLPLLGLGLTGKAVEIDALALSAAGHAAAAQGFATDCFEAGDSSEYARLAATAGTSYDLVLIDPPRAGVRSHLTSIAALARRFLVYCSCNPETLVRDIAELCAVGFEVESIAQYDMFPYTAHVETLVWLRRV